MNVLSIVRGAKFAALLLGALAIAGCAKNAQTDQVGMAGAATPGSQQDFIVNVGDRVFFETDSSELTPQSRTTLDKQAQWLNQYGTYAFTIEGHADERGTREYNIALGARRAQTVRATHAKNSGNNRADERAKAKRAERRSTLNSQIVSYSETGPRSRLNAPGPILILRGRALIGARETPVTAIRNATGGGVLAVPREPSSEGL